MCAQALLYKLRASIRVTVQPMCSRTVRRQRTKRLLMEAGEDSLSKPVGVFNLIPPANQQNCVRRVSAVRALTKLELEVSPTGKLRSRYRLEPERPSNPL